MIAFDRIGSGRPIAFLHSGVANRTMWEPQITAFSARYACWLLDLPGYGESEDPPSPFSCSAAIAAFIEQEIGQRTVLVGSSYGGGICFDTALAAPDLVGPMVLVDSIIEMDGDPSPQLRAIWTGADAAWEGGDKDRAVDIEIEGWVDGHARPKGRAAKEVRDYFTRVNRQVWERDALHPKPELLPGPDHDFGLIPQPVLLIDGPYDVAEVLTSNRLLLERLPNAEYVSIAGTAHFPSYERPKEFNRVVLEFLDRTWGDATA